MPERGESRPRWLVSFVRDIRSERKSAAQTEVIWWTERSSAAYDALSAPRYVQIVLALKMGPFDTNHLGDVVVQGRTRPKRCSEFGGGANPRPVAGRRARPGSAVFD